MKETSFSEAFYVLDNGYVAVNYSFNLSGNPEEPFCFYYPVTCAAPLIAAHPAK